jgi:hypothetical protein
MGNVYNQSFRENENTHFMPINVFSESVPFMRLEKCGDAVDDYGRALHIREVSLYARQHSPAHVHPH